MHATQCPICNGFSTIQLQCPHCNINLIDRGRYTDSFGDYSPYQPIDDLKKTDGIIDFIKHQCPHQLTCNHCSYSTVIMITES